MLAGSTKRLASPIALQPGSRALYNPSMLYSARRPQGQVHETYMNAGAQTVLLRLFQHARARRYVLRLCPDGTARVTLPRGGSILHALEFANRHSTWLANQLLRRAETPTAKTAWEVGSRILLRGEPTLLEATTNSAGELRLGSEIVRLKPGIANVRPAIEKYLWKLAKHELPIRVKELSGLHGFSPARVCIRNQRSRWGSCSRHGTISLNWRLIQTPVFVRDYIILHELAHLRHLNHSSQFWREVERLCPNYPEAETWLRRGSHILR